MFDACLRQGSDGSSGVTGDGQGERNRVRLVFEALRGFSRRRFRLFADKIDRLSRSGPRERRVKCN